MPSGTFNTGGKRYLVDLWANRTGGVIFGTHYGCLIRNTGGGIPDANQGATLMSSFNEITNISGYVRSPTTVQTDGAIAVDNILNTATYTYADDAFVFTPTEPIDATEGGGVTYLIVTDSNTGGTSVPRSYYDFSSAGTIPVEVPAGATLTLKNAKFRIKNAT